jgi:hypothetical protein
MNKPYIFIIALAFLAMCGNSTIKNGPMKNSTFSFEMSKSYRETSLDSHSYSDTYSLKSGTLSYDYIYSGYPAPDSKHLQMELDEIAISSIKDKLINLGLFKNYKKDFPIEKKSGPRNEQSYSLVINSDTTSYNISFDGNIPIDIDDEVYNSLSAFWSYISALINKTEK